MVSQREQKQDPRGIGRKGGFKSLGSHLPQNAYKGKVEKIREGLIHNAKVKRAYARTLKREEKAGILRPTTIFNESDQKENVEELDSEGLHPSRSQRLAAPEEDERVEKSQRHGKTKSRKTLTKEEKLALAEERRKEMERNQKERQKKIKQRERKRRDLRKMTSKGQPVMKTRLEDLLSKVKKVMKDT